MSSISALIVCCVLMGLATSVTSQIDFFSQRNFPALSIWKHNSRIAKEDVYNGCGISKGCIAEPYDCIDSMTCSMMTTYRKVSDAELELEIYGEVSDNQYVAVGFSKDVKMGDDSVVECVKNGNQHKAFTSRNYPGDTNKRIADLSGFQRLNASYTDGYIYCQVLHPVTFTSDSLSFNLNDSYHILMATGRANADSSITEHSHEIAAPTPISVLNNIEIQYFKGESRVVKQLHGSFMVVAWLMAASVGVFLPRYMKKTWVGKKIMKKDRWFMWHMGLMCCAWLLTVIAFIMIFIDVGGWVSESVSENPHPLIGCITMALAFIQPIMAAFRPDPDAPKRYIFNWAHSCVGYAAHILALTCIFLAVEMEEAELRYSTYWILTTHVVCYVAAHAALSFLAYRKPSALDAIRDDNPRDEQGSLTRKIILFSYACVAIALGITVIVFIAVEEEEE